MHTAAIDGLVNLGPRSVEGGEFALDDAVAVVEASSALLTSTSLATEG